MITNEDMQDSTVVLARNHKIAIKKAKKLFLIHIIKNTVCFVAVVSYWAVDKLIVGSK